MVEASAVPPRLLWGFAFLVASVATVGSLTFSGIGPLGWRGMGLFPCELCWYQRILMYPLPVIIGVGIAIRDARLPWLVLPFSVAGFLVAAYHVFLQANPEAEIGQCFVGACSVVQYQFLGVLSIPQLSLVAFFLLSAAAAIALALAPMGARAEGDAWT